MALTPAQMGDAILANLQAKTGYSLAHWLDVLRELRPPDRRTALAGLKSAGLGHFQAQTVYNASTGQDSPYADPAALTDTLFPPGTALRSTFEAFAKTCRDFGDDVTASPCQTYVPFYAARKFAAVRPDADDALYVALALPTDSPAIETCEVARGAGADERLRHAFVAPVGRDLTASERAALLAAYADNQ